MNPTRITVLQLARFGDLIQTSPLLRLLRHRRPEARLVLIVDERAAEVASMLRDVDEVHPVKLSKLPWRENLPFAGQLGDLAHWLAPLKTLPVSDWLIVLNQDPLAGALAELIPARQLAGPRLRQALPPPHRYLAASVADRRYNPLHLSEIWAAYSETIDPEGTAEKTRIPQPSLRDGVFGTGLALLEGERGTSSLKGKRYALNPGAGAAARCLPAASLAGLLRKFAPDDEVVLLGLPVDIPLARRLAGSLPRERAPRLVDLTGRTTLRDLPGVLSGCDALISGDTGTLQLSAATGTPSVGLFFGGANPVETGAFAADAVALVRRDTLATNEDLATPPEEFPVRTVAALAHALAEGRPIDRRMVDADDDWAVLVARTDDVGVRYTPLSGTLPVELGAAGRWLPYLRALLGGAGDPVGGRQLERGPVKTARGRTGDFRALMLDPNPANPAEQRWLHGIAAAFPETIQELLTVEHRQPGTVRKGG